MSMRLLGSAAAEFRLLALRRQTWDRIIYILLLFTRRAAFMHIYNSLNAKPSAGQTARKWIGLSFIKRAKFFESKLTKMEWRKLMAEIF